MGTSEVSRSPELSICILAADPHRMLITGLAGVALVEIYAAVMQRQFQNTDNRIGKGFAILGIYLFVVYYCTHSDQRC